MTKADDYIKFTPPASAQRWTIESHGAYVPIADWDVSGTYTVSVDVKFDNLKSAPAFPGVCLSAVTNNTTVGYMARVYERMFTIIPTTNDWTHFEYTVSGDYTTWSKPGSGTPAYIKVYIWLYLNSSNADAVSFRRLKLEKGNKATDWTPAPEDQTSYVDDSVSSIQVGGRNLLYDTSDWSKWAKTAKATATNDVLTCTNTDTSSGFQRANGWFIPDKADVMDREIVISFDAKKTDSTALSSLVFQMFTTSAAPRSVASGNINEGTRVYQSLGAASTDRFVIENAGSINATTWTRVSLRFIPSVVFNQSYTEQAYLAVYIGINNTVASAQFRHIKAEYGNKATDWTPAPEDTPQYRVVTTSYSYTLAQWLTYAAEGYTSSWARETYGQGVRAGDTVMLKGTNSDNGSAVYVLMTVNTLNTSGAIANATSHGLIDPTAGQRADSAQSTANAAAPKANAVKRTQRIWYRTNASSAPSTPGTASSNWVTKADDGNDAWTKMHIAISSTHKYIYTCEQYEMANGTVGYTSVLLDNTITVIDGGNIITGSVTANKLNAADINASKSLTVGAMTDAAASTILNSNVVVGGRNLLPVSQFINVSLGPDAITSDGYVTDSTPSGDGRGWSYANSNWHVYLEAGTYTISWETVVVSTSSSQDLNVWGETSRNWRVQPGSTAFTSIGKKSITFDVSESGNHGVMMKVYDGKVRFKLEKGNKATDWTPAPEDVESSIIEASKTASNYITADSTGIKIHMSGSNTTYQHQSSTATTYYVNGNKRAEVGTNGLKVYVGTTGSESSVAEFGTTARLGLESGYHTEVTSTGMRVSDGTDDVVRIHSEVTQDGVRYGSIDIGKYADGTLTSVGGSAEDYTEDDYVYRKRTAELTAMASTGSDGAWVEAWAEHASTWDEDNTGVTLRGKQLDLYGPNGEGYGSVSMENAGKVISTQSGIVSQSISAAANAVTTHTVTFPNPYDVAPIVVACFYSTSSAAAFGGLSLAVSAITTTSFTVKIFNNTGTGRSPGLFWIATPQTSQT